MREQRLKSCKNFPNRTEVSLYSLFIHFLEEKLALGIVHVLHRLQKSNSSYRCVVETSLILLTGLHMTVLRYYHSTLNYSL